MNVKLDCFVWFFEVFWLFFKYFVLEIGNVLGYKSKRKLLKFVEIIFCFLCLLKVIIICCFKFCNVCKGERIL